MEIVPTMETVPDKYDNNEGIVPFNHGTPVVANNAPMATAAMMVIVQQAHVRILCRMKCLGGWFNPMALKYIAQSNKNGKLEVIDEEVDKVDGPNDATTCRVGREVANVMLSHAVSKFSYYSTAKDIEKQAVTNGEDHHFVEPKNFCEAFDHPDPIQCEKWHMAIHKEFSDMTNHGIWHKVKWSQVPASRHCIKCKWVLKVKRESSARV